MIVSLALGAVIGLIMALTGAGGGILATPLLVFGARLSVVQAGPIGLLAVGLAATLGAIMGLRDGIVRYKAGLVIACAGMIMSPFGLWLAHRLPNRPLELIFAGVLIWVAYNSYSQVSRTAATAPDATERQVPCRINPDTGRFIWTLQCARVFFGAGSVAGFLSGLLGVGGGFVLIPALRRCTDLTIQSVIATSLAVIALVSLSGVVTSALGGHLVWAVGLPFSGGALAGMLAGRRIGPRLASAHLHKAFALLAALVAASMIGKALL